MVLETKILESVKNALLKEMERDVRNVISGDLEEYSCEWLNPSYVLTYIEDKYNEHFFDQDINGWQGDVFYTVKIDDKIYTVSGSGYYGGVKFSLHDNDD